MKAPIYMSLDMLFSTNEANLQAQLPGTTHDHLQIFNIEIKNKMKSHQMPEQVVFWKWVSPKTLGIVTHTSVYHWSLEGDSEPVKMFDRTGSLSNNQIINYRCDPSEKWLVLIGIAPGSAERPQLVKGNMHLYSVDQQRSQALEAHATSFASYKVPGNENPSSLICFATKSFNAGNVTSKLHVIELGAQPGKPSFAKKQVDLFFPPDFADDFPVGMQISHKYGLVNVITKSGLLFVYDLETATAVYRNRISSDPIFLTCEASSVGGFYAVNRRGQVLLATVNESAIVPFVSGQLNNLELALSLAKRGNLPGAENLVVQRFQELFNQTKYKEAAELAAESPQGILRTPEIIAKFQCYLQKKAVEWIKIVTMLTDLGQRGGILRLVGKVSLLWGGIRDALSLIGKLITFMRLAERPLFQRMGRDMIYDSWSCNLLCAASSPELYRINLEQSGSDAEDDQSSDDEPANGKSKDAKKSRASRLYEVKDERHAEVFNNHKSLAREDALPFEERVKALKQ